METNRDVVEVIVGFKFYFSFPQALSSFFSNSQDEKLTVDYHANKDFARVRNDRSR